MDVEEEDKTVFYSLFFETAKEHLKKQIYTNIYLVFQQKKKNWHISSGRVSDIISSFEKICKYVL